ncbi:MAG: helix-turn-helix transcriptional regulator [Levilactobacillus sp.]|jgi:DNA-binding XRE family transcriptional regulator|uniref:helix-turn-helix domain-containing protein n=1 Tax=Levilactobacillus sp. TaxID=2767919 RepID=UPI002583439C|nr:helix-turn-helix transcriptional regulator [Levilactobacillus sp.]MCI1552985.1 helix-turn-helix transcriptional regulator [Levilactobacillus sp.]MCI1598126.1 helix-turn-helix transcriptional regulator [Levilactobacillus sp.]MCI1605545.1 helix-turn-helix transcriptional regulator [Levilactobacillus sp.]
MTSKIDEYIAQQSAKSAEFAAQANQTAINLEVAVAVRKLREEKQLTQREFGKLVGKPQSTIARIEEGQMNVSVKVLSEIAAAVNKKVILQFT